jgi:hypothetical protein
MVEMLGVLAIIGVLSIGGLAAYSYGMMKYRTNELLEGASRRAYTVASQVAMNRTPSLTEFQHDTNAGGTFVEAKALGEKFGLKVTGVSEEVCKNLIKISSESTIIQDITSATDTNTKFTEADCSGDNNSFMIIYNNNMGSGDGEDTTPATGFCATNTCDLDCNGIPCAKVGDGMDFSEIEEACGGLENMVTAEDLGCTLVDGGYCANSLGGKFWLGVTEERDHGYLWYDDGSLTGVSGIYGAPPASALCK